MQSGAPRIGLLVMALCPVHVSDVGEIVIDRKHHAGMLEYQRRLQCSVAGMLPAAPREVVMRGIDPITVNAAGLPYEIIAVPAHDNPRVIEGAVARSDLVCLPTGEPLAMPTVAACRRLGVPYVAVLEWTLGIGIDIAWLSTSDPIRRAYRVVRSIALYPWQLGMVRRSVEVHCNGYPSYKELAWLAPDRIRYFDTRARAEDIIRPEELRARLASRRSRERRVIFSGRYEALKGALDVVRAAVALVRRAHNVRVDLYGKGSLRDEMRGLAQDGGVANRLEIHDAIPYPELVRITRASDLALSCHVQGDPSCTYLETMAAGVPIVGYPNASWTPLCRESGAGVVTKRRRPNEIAERAARLLDDDAALDAASEAARVFASRHTMDDAWALRIERLKRLLHAETRPATARG